MGFIETFLRKNPKDVTKEDVETFISRKTEENLNLDYTFIETFFRFDELSKDVSAFANSEGGLLMLGVSQDEIREGNKVVKVLPKEITWGGETLSKEQLEDNLAGKIQPRVDGLRIQPIREGNGSMKVIFLLDIPQSNNQPHMAADKRYHKRLNFRRIRMEHFEVANLLKLRWVLNEKMIEKIYEPLASVLEKNAKEFERYNSPNTSEIVEILSRTYYKWQMPIELLDELEHYVSQIKVLDKKLHFARREIKNICCRNVLKYLDIKTQPSIGYPELRFRLFFEKSEGDLHPTTIYEYLMKNKSIKDYVEELFYPGKCEKISINCMDKWHQIKLEDFNQLVWKNCLKEAKENPEVVQMKENADALWEWAQALIETITTTS